jgi:hypothetical protein
MERLDDFNGRIFRVTRMTSSASRNARRNRGRGARAAACKRSRRFLSQAFGRLIHHLRGAIRINHALAEFLAVRSPMAAVLLTPWIFEPTLKSELLRDYTP